MKPDLGGNRLFVYEDFYAGIALGQSEIHLKCIEDVDPGIAYVQQSEHVTLYCWTPLARRRVRQLLTASHQGRVVRMLTIRLGALEKRSLKTPMVIAFIWRKRLTREPSQHRLLRGHWRQLLRTK